MRYIIRAVKYFIQVSLILAIILAILMILHVVSPDINTAFSHGWKSVGWIAIAFACVSAVYPRFGYVKRDANIAGEFSDIRQGIIDFMNAHHYILEKEDGENMYFRLKSSFSRASRMFEDRISLEREFGGYKVEGLNKDVVRLVYGLETKFRTGDTAQSPDDQ